MINFSYREVDHVSALAEIFAVNTGTTQNLMKSDSRWRIYALRKLFGMNRFPFQIQPTVPTFTAMTSDRCCTEFFELIVSGDIQSDTSHSMNLDDTIIMGTVHFQQCPSWYKTWDVILKHPNSKVIYTRRPNPLELAVSSANAFQQQKWQVGVNDSAETQYDNVHLDPRQLTDFLVFHDSQLKYFDWKFGQRDNALCIDYVDMVEDWDETTNKISDFLELDVDDVKLMTRKQILTNNYLSLIKNLGDLIVYFKDSPWESYFKV